MDGFLVVCRVLHFSAAMGLFGASVFLWWLAPPVITQWLTGRLRTLAAAAIFIIGLTAVTWLLLAAGEMGEGWPDTWNLSTIATVLFNTEFGHVWLWHMIVAVVLFGFLFTGRHDHWARNAALSALLLVDLGLIGHAAIENGTLGLASRTSHILHLLAAGFWIGALIPLSATLRVLNDPEMGNDASLALRRFSGLGHFAVSVVLVTGLINTWLVLGDWPVHFSSPYQILLLIKIVAVLSMVGIAVVNRYVLMPSLHERHKYQRFLQRNTMAEIVIGVGVIALVSVFGLLPPI